MADSGGSVRRFAFIMGGYAALLAGLGVLAYTIAPAGANKITALIVPGAGAMLAVTAAVTSLLIGRHRLAGMIGIHLGLILPLVMAAGVFGRLPVAYKSAGVHDYVRAQFDTDRASREGAGRELSPDAIAAYYENASIDANRDAGIPAISVADHDKTYLGNVLTLIFGLSTAAFVALLATRPRVPKPNPEPAPTAPEPAAASEDLGGAAPS